MRFADATRVASQGDGRFSGEIEEGWDIVGNANGGYLMAIAARAASVAAGDLPPSTVTAHFLNPGRPGQVEISTSVAKQGRRFTTVQATMNAGERPLVALLGSFSSEPPSDHPVERIEASPPKMPDPEDCIPVVGTNTFPPPMMNKIELRLHPDDVTFEANHPMFRGWFRLLEDEPIEQLVRGTAGSSGRIRCQRNRLW